MLFLFGVSVKGKQRFLHVFKHVTKDIGFKTSLKVSLMSAVRPGAFVKVSSVTSVPVLAVDVKILENVIKFEGVTLVGTRSMTSLCLPGEVCRGITKLVIFPSSGFIGQRFISCAKKDKFQSRLEN